MAKVTLDVETFKALASPTRLDVLRALDERRKTLSELAKELDLNKATIHEHLQLLVACELVKKRDDEGRKWIYYELTWQGERLLHPQETTTFAVLLGISVAAAGGGLALLGRALDWWWQEKQLQGIGEGDDFGTKAADSPEAGPQAESADEAEPAGGSGGSNGPSAASAPPAEESRMADANGTAADAPATSSEETGFFDEDGILSILLLLTSIFLVVLATIVRKRR